MGSLRFRKSVSLIPGVKLNFGKKGVSISSGVPGFRKTYNFNTGKTTTSVGIPGTGIYYVDTKGPSKKKEEKVNSGFRSGYNDNQAATQTATQRQSSYSPQNNHPPVSSRISSPIVAATDGNRHNALPSEEGISVPQQSEIVFNDSFVSSDPKTVVTENTPIDTAVVEPPVESVIVEEKKSEEITYEIINEIFENCDVAVNWVDVLSHKTPTSDEVVSETWEYLHKKAVAVFDGDIDAYLEIISTVNPYDDLLEYAKDFEFGTDDSNVMEVEFSVTNKKTQSLLKSVFEDYYSAIAIRVARDTFALLPVEKTIVHINHSGKEILSVTFDRDKFHESNLVGKDASGVIKELSTKSV